MAMQDERRQSEKGTFKRSKQLESWERQQMASHDRNKHRPRRLRDATGRWELWERRQMASQDKAQHQPRRKQSCQDTSTHTIGFRSFTCMHDMATAPPLTHLVSLLENFWSDTLARSRPSLAAILLASSGLELPEKILMFGILLREYLPRGTRRAAGKRVFKILMWGYRK